MGEVGIRALKQNASAVIADAVAGEVITVTDRGRPVARISPIRRTPLADLEAGGLIRKRKHSITAVGAPQPAPAGRSISAVLDELRADRPE